MHHDACIHIYRDEHIYRVGRILEKGGSITRQIRTGWVPLGLAIGQIRPGGGGGGGGGG